MKSLTADVDWQPRWVDLVRSIACVRSERGVEQLLHSLSHAREPRIVAFVNAHVMNEAASSAKFFDSLMAADLLLRDGIGMAILLRLLNQPVGLNLNGTDLIPRILAQFSGRPIALFGTRDPYLGRARAVVSGRVAPGSDCVAANGFLDTASYVRLAAAAHRPALIVLGMGIPRQEEVAFMLRASLDFPCVIVCGGAIIDFLGHRTVRAPAWMRAAGLEWLFRLALEPRRLFRRYVLGNPVFIARALKLTAALSRLYSDAATQR